jgi:hypothetical protein
LSEREFIHIQIQIYTFCFCKEYTCCPNEICLSEIHLSVRKIINSLLSERTLICQKDAFVRKRISDCHICL